MKKREMKKKRPFVDVKDRNVPVGKRRIAYVKYLMSECGESLERAKYLAKSRRH